MHPIFLIPARDFFVRDSSFWKSGLSTVLKLKHDFPCIRAIKPSEQPSSNFGLPYTPISW